MTLRAHVVVLLIAIGSVAFILRLVRRRQLRAKYSLLWVVVACSLLVTAAVPGLFDRLSRAVGIDYPPAAYFLVAVTFLLLLVMHFSWELSRLEERTRTLAEELALLRAEGGDGRT